MREALEWHDSELQAIECLDGRVLLRVAAYVHLEDDSSVDAKYTGWIAPVQVTIDGGTVQESVPTPVEIAEAEMRFGEAVVGNVVSLPFSSSVGVVLICECIGGRVVVSGDGISISRTGPREFREVNDFGVL